MNRRDFLKCVVAFLFNNHYADNYVALNMDTGKAIYTKWHQNILFIVNDICLLKEFKIFAERNNLTVIVGKQNSTAILGIPAFVIIVDRVYLGLEYWESYCSYRDEVPEDETLVICLDHSLELESCSNMIYMANDPESIFIIILEFQSKLIIVD